MRTPSVLGPGIGSQWGNLLNTPEDGSNVELGVLLFYQIVSWIFWIFMVFYVDAVNPWQSGIPASPLFCLKYFGSRPNNANCEESLTSVDDHKVEPVPADVGAPVIRVVRVTHCFGDVKALDNLSLEIYANQMTVLLGHNGAGKTTVMNIMTGLFAPDRGDIFIHGHSISKDTKKAREDIGLCPQHNTLFDYLTVEEHLRFFAKLKGSKEAAENEIDSLLARIDLLPHKSVLSCNLSGGMKRKLSLANAAIGGSKVR